MGMDDPGSLRPLSNFAARILNRCLPVRHNAAACYLCGANATGGMLCASCWRDLPRPTGIRCTHCAVELARPGLCPRCSDATPGIDGAVAGLVYRYPVDVLLAAFKYSGVLALAGELSRALLDALAGAPRPDLIIPVPLSAQRLRTRGYNQSAVLAERIATSLAVPLRLRGAFRRRDTPRQAGLVAHDRARNLVDAFACSGAMQGLHVAVVDDVLTTGATLDALAQVLKQSGVRRVSAWVVARTPRDWPS